MASRTCNDCGIKKTLDSTNFRKSKTKPKIVWEPMCKLCKSRQVRDHYRRWNSFDVKERGETGVRCILYSKELCQVCPCPSITELEDCRRLEGTSPEYDDFPDPLPQ